MVEVPSPTSLVRFGVFELDRRSGELRKAGVRISLQEQALQVLTLLLERPGDLVTRDELRQRLWPDGTVVDFEHGLNAVVNRLRDTLGDSADSPRFIETLPRRGYRFVAPIERDRTPSPAVEAAPGASTEPSREFSTSAVAATIAPSSQRSASRRTRVAIGMVVVATIASAGAWKWLAGGAPISRVTLAVLPFKNLGSDPEREYLADGLTGETSASIAQIDPERLSVKGRTLRYKGTTKTVAEIGQELSVDYLLESAIRAEGARLRVTAALIRVRDQEYVWSQTYEREPASLLGLQKELSTAIAEQVRLRLSADRLSGIGRRQTQDAGAFDEYLRGRYLRDKRTPQANALALQHFERAVARDPNYALAWCELAATYAVSAINGDARPLEVWPRARDAATRAVRANPNLAESQLTAANISWWFDWDWRAAEAGTRRGIVLDPSNATAHLTLGHMLSQQGRHSEAASEVRRAQDLDPLSPLIHALSSQVAFQARDYPSAVDHARRTILVNSQFWIGYMQLGQAYERTGESDLALEALRDATRFSGGNSKAVSLRGYVLAKTGRIAEAREVLRTLEAVARERYMPPYAIALVHAGLGEREAMFDWLDKAYVARDVHLIFLPVDPKWDPYRTDARFQALVTRCGFTPTAATPAHTAITLTG
jgi:TolB-like protein/DNA-binding winged helix-turn-helix (wHTH) protein